MVWPYAWDVALVLRRRIAKYHSDNFYQWIITLISIGCDAWYWYSSDNGVSCGLLRPILIEYLYFGQILLKTGYFDIYSSENLIKFINIYVVSLPVKYHINNTLAVEYEPADTQLVVSYQHENPLITRYFMGIHDPLYWIFLFWLNVVKAQVFWIFRYPSYWIFIFWSNDWKLIILIGHSSKSLITIL